MFKLIASLVILGGGIWLSMTSMAAAQSGVAYGPSIYTAPVVSPYLNLGLTSTGLSNYQTFVKPMIDEQNEMMRQSTSLQQLQQQRQIQDGQASRESQNTSGRPRPKSATRFNYSHFYSGLR